MAAQQNSTLIYDNVDDCPTLLSLPDELKRYSPILPPQTQINQNPQQIHNQHINNKHDINSNNNNNYGNCNKADNNDVKKLRECRKRATYNRLQQQQQQQRAGSSYGGQSRRSRSISLYGINSTVEQGNKEIPIWVGEETRYVSGVTSRTTCNDIIKALIDDEIRNGNPIYCARQNKYGAASRDCSDYVITESWRGIERSYDGNMAILPVWKAWSRVHNELRLSLKHHTEVPDPNKFYAPMAPMKWYYPLRKYLNKLFKFSKRNHNKAIQQPPASRGKSHPPSAKDDIPDEILFVILPDKVYDNKADPAPNVPHKVNEKPGFQNEQLLKERLYRLSETRASTRKRQQRTRSRSRRKDGKSLQRRRASPNGNNCIQRRRDMPTRHSLRQQLAQKTTEIDDLYQREYALTKELTNKCQLYKLQNELYTKPGQHLELSVGQIQRNIEQYGEEIIKAEHELLELKNEIRQDISIVNNLKRLTLGQGNRSEGLASEALDGQQRDEATVNESTPLPAQKEANDQMQFVDNIYEFCDNNASMLV